MPKKGYKPTKEHRINLSLATKGRTVWNKGLKGYMGGLTPFPNGHIPWNKGLKNFNSGENNPNWKDGISKSKFYNRINHFKRRNKIGILTLKTIQIVYENNIKQFGTLTCYLCFKPISFGKDCIEHKTPISRGGTHTRENLDIAHRKCNCKKHIKTELEYREENFLWL